MDPHEAVETAGTLSPVESWLVLLLIGWLGVCAWIALTQLTRGDR